MKRMCALVPVLAVLFVSGRADAQAQEPAKVQITIKVSDKTPSFKDMRLVVFLSHDNPLQGDRADTAVDRYINPKFSHEKGKETVLTVTLGEKAKIKAGVQYDVSVAVFDAASKRTHTAENKDGTEGPFDVLTNGGPSKVTVTIKPAKGPVIPPPRG